MSSSAIRLPDGGAYGRVAGIGGIGTGMFLVVEGDRTMAGQRPVPLG